MTQFRRLRQGRWIAVILLLVAPGCRTPAVDPALPVTVGSARGADVILITLDTTRADHLGCYGMMPSVTPNLDRLCADGVRFSNAVTPSPLTLPAHSSILSGLSPPHHGARYNGEFRLGDNLPTIATDLRSAGYQTAAFLSSFVLDARYGTARGFDVYDAKVDGVIRRNGVVSHNERGAAATTAAALNFLRHRDRDRPVFLWVHYYDAHAPYVPLRASIAPGSAEAYAGEIADVDAELGRLLQAPQLDSARTLVIVTADHGEGLGEHGERAHGLFLYDSTTHVPLIVKLPSTELAGRTIDTLATLMDIRPSLLSLLGLPTNGTSDGIDWLREQRGADATVYQEAALSYFDFGYAPVYALRAVKARFIDGEVPEYYDLASDPHEQNNQFAALSGTPANPADALRQQLDTSLLGITDLIEAAKQSDRDDPKMLAKLRSLGYLGDGAPTVAGPLADTHGKLPVINLHMEATGLIDAGHYSQALALLNEADRLSPANIAILRLKSKAELFSGQIDAAEHSLQQLLALRRNPDSLVLFAQILILRKDHTAAGILLDEAERLEPDHGGIFIARGDIAAANGDGAAAAALYEQAVQRDASRTGAVARSRLAQLVGRH